MYDGIHIENESGMNLVEVGNLYVGRVMFENWNGNELMLFSMLIVSLWSEWKNNGFCCNGKFVVELL